MLLCPSPQSSLPRLLLLVAGVPLLTSATAQDLEGSCPAGAGGVASCRVASATGSADAGGAHRPAAGPALQPKAAALPQRKANILDQELEELRGLTRLYRERMALLRELRAAVNASMDGQGTGLPESHVRALKERIAPLSELARSEETNPAASFGDFLVSKAVVPQEEEVSIVKFLPLRNPRGSAPMPVGQVAMPSTLVVAAQLDGTLRLFMPSGELASSFSAGHDQPLLHVAVSPSQDEYVVASCDVGGIVRVHKVTVRQRRVSKEEREARRMSVIDKVSQHLGSQVNVTVQFNRQFRVPDDGEGARPRLTTLIMASQQGTKYFITGDANGTLTVFTRNGTLHARMETGSAIKSIYVHVGTVLYLSGGMWGFIDLENMVVRQMICPRFHGRVNSVVVDSQQQARVVAADEDGDIWVFNVQNKRHCKIEHRFPKGTARPLVELASVRGFTFVLDRVGAGEGHMSLSALNMSHVGKKRQDPTRSSPVTVWRKVGPRVRSWAVHKRYQQGDLMAFLSEDGYEIEVFEVLMQVYIMPAPDSFGNFKLPVFAIAIVMVLGYQYVKGKGAFEPGSAE